MHESYKVFRGNGLLMDLESLKAAVFTDRTNQGFYFHKVVGIINCDGLILARPGSFSEGVEGKYSFVNPEELYVLMSSGPYFLMHLGEEGAVVGLLELENLLAAPDEFEFDSVLFVGSVKEIGGDLELRELPVEHDYPLLEG